METVFLYILNKSITAGWMILAVLLIRIVLKRLPKWVNCILWIMVGIRLICPIGFQSDWSLIPSAHTVSDVMMYTDEPTINSGIEVIDQLINPVLPSVEGSDSSMGDKSMALIIEYVSYIWIVGIASLAVHSMVRWSRLRNRVRASIRVKDQVYICDDISAPFILGVFRPRVYLPSTLSEEHMKIVLDHENAHLSRDDHWTKMLGFILVILHWFNPLVWLACQKMSEDIELACDEKVIRGIDNQSRKKYMQVLLEVSQVKTVFFNSPLAFGEVGVKKRIRSMIQYKKMNTWAMTVSILIWMVCMLCFMTNPKKEMIPKADLSIMTKREKMIYEEIKEIEDFCECYLVDITGDGENELLSVVEYLGSGVQSSPKDMFTFWGTDEEGKVVMVCRKFVQYSGVQKPFNESLYLYPEDNGSYTLLSDSSRRFDFRKKIEYINLVKNKFVLQDGKYICEKEVLKTEEFSWNDPIYLEYREVIEKSCLLVDSEIKAR